MKTRKPECIKKNFKHMGHNYEVSKVDGLSGLSRMSGFCYYIFVPADETKTINETKSLCDYAGEFHGGVTYCHLMKGRTFDNPDPNSSWQQDYEYYKIGCDYAHLGDEGRDYDEDEICFDAENTIDKLIDAKILEDMASK